MHWTHEKLCLQEVGARFAITACGFRTMFVFHSMFLRLGHRSSQPRLPLTEDAADRGLLPSPGERESSLQHKRARSMQSPTTDPQSF